MSEPDKPALNWNIELNFDLSENREINTEKIPPPPPIPPRMIIKDKFPKILERIELLWGSLELHDYLERTLFTDRSARQGFPENVMKALGAIHNEHVQVLKAKGVITFDVWDKTFDK